MKKFPLILFLVCFIFQVNSQNLYEDALIAASYAYAHSKKAHGANNVFHTQEYADKARSIALHKRSMLHKSQNKTQE